jgi:hypothetical protein
MKKLTTIFLSILLLTQTILPAFADGMLWEYNDTKDEWNLLPETRQRAYINHEDGIQKMLLSINVESLSENETVWIFPVPAQPNETVIDIIDEFPTTNGSNLREEAKEKLVYMFEGIRFSQLYYIPLFALVTEVFDIRYYRSRAMGVSYGVTEGMQIYGGSQELTIYEHIEKEGLITELITAQNSNALEDYFESKGLTIPEESNKIIDEYIGKDFSFVVSWKEKEEIIEEIVEEVPPYPSPMKVPKPTPVSDRGIDLLNAEPNSSEAGTTLLISDEYVNTKIGKGLSVYVSFPTEKIFFPLKPTSLYGSTEIPVWIFVKGFAEPDTFESIKPYTDTEYLVKSSFYEYNKDLQNLLGMKEERVKNYAFTKITIQSPSKLFTEDLIIEKGSPLIIKLARVIANDWGVWILGIILFIILSCLSSILAGLIAFHGQDLPKKHKLLLMGLWNLLTFIGFLFANIYMKTKSIPQAFEAKLKAENTKVIIRDRRKIGYAILFTTIFLALSAIVEIILFYSL